MGERRPPTGLGAALCHCSSSPANSPLSLSPHDTPQGRPLCKFSGDGAAAGGLKHVGQGGLGRPGHVDIPPRYDCACHRSDLRAIEAHRAAWDLAREASDDDIDALMAAEGRPAGGASENDTDHDCRVRSNERGGSRRIPAMRITHSRSVWTIGRTHGLSRARLCSGGSPR